MAMTNTLHPTQRHLLLEALQKAETSFIANINTVTLFIKNEENMKNLRKVPELVDDYEEVKAGLADTNNKVLNLSSSVDNIATRMGDIESIGIVNRFNYLDGVILSHDARISALEAGGGGGGGGGDMSNYYTKLEVDYRLNQKRSIAESYTINETNELLNKRVPFEFGEEFAGKVLMVDEDGFVTTGNVIQTWEELEGDPTESVALSAILDTKADITDIGNGTLTIKDTTGVTLAIFYANQTMDTTCIIPSSGSGGTTDYTVLTSKPKINGVELLGDKTTKDLKIKAMSVQSSATPTFSSFTMLESAVWTGIAHDNLGNTVVVGVSTSNTPVCYITSNGTVWRKITGIEGVPLSVAYGNGRWVITTRGTAFYTSEDGSTYTKKNVPDGNWTKLLFTGTKFIALNNNEEDTVGSMDSIDGLSWTQRANSGYTFSDAVYANGQLVILSADSKTVVSTANLTTWTSHTLPDATFSRMVYFNGRYVITTEDTSTIYWSYDLNVWNSYTVPAGVTAGFTAATVTESAIILFQNGGVAYSNMDMTTEDWKELVIPVTTDWNVASYKNGYIFAFGGHLGARDRAAIGIGTESLVQEGTDVTDKVATILQVKGIQDNLLNKDNSVYFDYNVMTKTYMPTISGSTCTISPNYAVSVLNVTSNCIINIGGFDSGHEEYESTTITLFITNGGAYNVIWNNNILWPEGVAPKLTTSGTDIITFITPNHGGTWYGTSLLNMMPATA